LNEALKGEKSIVDFKTGFVKSIQKQIEKFALTKHELSISNA